MCRWSVLPALIDVARLPTLLQRVDFVFNLAGVIRPQDPQDPQEFVSDNVDLTQAPVHIFRLPNVFSKRCKPNYNSAVATFCRNIARGPLQVQAHADRPGA